jgi:hypothetical protein
VQELKSTQAQLPAAVAAAMAACGWLNERGRPTSGSRSDAAAQPANAFAVPGLTITSFHLGQLQASAEVLPVHTYMLRGCVILPCFFRTNR